MLSWQIFAIGAAGAAAPEVLRLYSLRMRPNEFVWSWNYLLLSLPFFALGGLIATILPATTTWGAFYAGLSAPTLVNTIIKRSLRSSDDPETADENRIGTLAESRLRGAKAFVQAL